MNKRRFCLLILLLGSTILLSAPLGKIRFLIGEVHYRKNQNAPWKSVTLNQEIELAGFIKTGPGSTAEILWNNNLSTTVTAKSQVAVKQLYDELNSQKKWVQQVKDKVSGLSLQNKQKTSTAAGIRREEAQLEIQTELYWDAVPLQDIQEAVDLFERREFNLAIPLFLLVIEQGPLAKEAELAHGYLILSYEELKNTAKRDEHIRILKTDFPQSSIIPSLPEIY